MRPFLLVSALALSVALTASAARAAACPRAADPHRRASQLPRTARPLHYTIRINPDAAHMRFAGTETVEIALLEASDSLTLNAVNIDFNNVTLTGPGAAALHPTGAQRQ